MARAAATLLIAGLGGTTGFAVVGTGGTDPGLTLPTVHTTTRTVTVHARDRVDGHPVTWWARRARHNGHLMRARGITLRRIRRTMRTRWTPSVRYGLRLANAAFGVDQTRRARCESGLDPYAVEGHGPLGLLQFQPSTWRSTPFAGFSIWDPVAQALAGGWMVAHGRSGEWACRL